MPTIVQGTLPAEAFALDHTLSSVPGLRVECERLVQSGAKSVMPLLWMRGADRDVLDDTLDEDPTVGAVSCLAAVGDTDSLWRIEWADRVRYLLEMVTNGRATVLDIHTRDDRWCLSVLYPTREHFSRTHQFATDHGLAFDVASIRETGGEPSGRVGLTDGQREVLVRAARQGYFDVPRDVDLEGLADDCEVSHQALSERLRRGMGTLIEDTLLVGAGTEQPEELSI
ncbi:helix-turn-helix domain-containing protein [Haloarcula onubensis]|uniref:Helix-turn-helix domain-containing protein n=1 Tax=Haloarcula onubensis TaxID=2950539 RepID=A0ABU2FL95_9EURY|nr:helix-turn-helix domain-containing protein [Halomicroarcula sp. S3CR25-11]MDS0281533.1 helix-turn-helix domain-containing protein [Halomicroarcula sp. S3CR25-11]